MSDKVIEKKIKEVVAWNPPVEWVREVIQDAGTTIGSVHFNKRSDGELRKMCYRLHVKRPSVAIAPKGLTQICSCCGKAAGKCSIGPYTYEVKKSKRSKRKVDLANDQITVLDANKVVRDKEGKVIGRGAWRTVPLEKVVRISNKGTTYTIIRNR